MEKQLNERPLLRENPKNEDEATEVVKVREVNDKNETLEIKEETFDLESRIIYRGQPDKETSQVYESEATDTKGQIIALRSKATL